MVDEESIRNGKGGYNGYSSNIVCISLIGYAPGGRFLKPSKRISGSRSDGWCDWRISSFTCLFADCWMFSLVPGGLHWKHKCIKQASNMGHRQRLAIHSIERQITVLKSHSHG